MKENSITYWRRIGEQDGILFLNVYNQLQDPIEYNIRASVKDRQTVHSINRDIKESSKNK